MTRRIFVDTEWSAPPWSAECELMWVGLADEEGNAWCGVQEGADLDGFRGDLMRAVAPLVKHEQVFSREGLATAVREFCGPVDEFWAWLPSLERFAAYFGLGDEAEDLFTRHWDVDLAMLRDLVVPWPEGWPERLCNLGAAAEGIELPERQPDHMHPRVHALWNRDAFLRLPEDRRDCARWAHPIGSAGS
ncbi:MAG: hypothetical protein HKN46_03410 [Acidimicrobiia bacterium]|nr:hypothetical protein [Acidimicrobiia bacterium]